MKHLSIKLILAIFISFIIALESAIFFGVYYKNKTTTEELLKSSLQTNMLSLNHFLKKNFQPNAVNGISSQINNFIIINKAIADIHILDENQKVLYYTKMKFLAQHSKQEICTPIQKIMKTKLLKSSCYAFTLIHYDNLTPLQFQVKIYLNKKYIRELENQQVYNFLIMLTLSTLILITIIYFLARKYIMIPLESLRRYAYYSEYPPAQLFVKEFESISYSLEMTFKKLKSEQENLYDLSTRDPLTGLYNRHSLTEYVTAAISDAKRSNGQFALLFLDLDNFKNINDSKGHNFGDIILGQVAKNLTCSVRENDIVSRVGGDEFVILLNHIENENTIIEVLNRIKELFSTPLQVEDNNYNVTASIGITLYPKDGKEFHTLLKNADIAMYQSKKSGKNSYHFFTENLNTIVQNRVQIQREINDALQNNRFKLFYQPKVDIQTNKIVACEALIRLIDKDNRIVAPDVFIPIAEESGLIVPLGEWVLKEGCRQIQDWSQTQFRDIQISINISELQLENKDFFATLSESVKCLDTTKLDIELTESVLINDFNDKLKLLDKIKALGITLSLDDFGTGYSSLSYLRKIPFDNIKIDKSFIDSMQEDSLFVNMILNIAKSLKLKVIAEGVETQEQCEYLKCRDCEMYQGYLASKPLPVEEFEALCINFNKSNNHS